MRTLALTPGDHNVVIPVRVLHYAPGVRQDWDERWRKWISSGQTKWEYWGHFENIARSYGFDRYTAPADFAEAQVALELEKSGYTVWLGPALFRRGKADLVGAEDLRAAEEQIAMMRLPLPRDFAHRISPSPQNPDLTAFHPEGRWRFCEVKQREPVEPGQWVGLAVLHCLLGAEVEVVRVLPEGAGVKQAEFTCSFALS